VPVETARPRFRITIGVALIAILGIGLILGWVEHVRREKRRDDDSHGQLSLQDRVTQAVLSQAKQDLVPPGVAPRTSSMGVGGSWTDWRTTVKMAEDRSLIDLEVRGSMEGNDLRPIRIIDRGGELHPEILGRLRAEYARRKWAYVVEHAERDPDRPATPAGTDGGSP